MLTIPTEIVMEAKIINMMEQTYAVSSAEHIKSVR